MNRLIILLLLLLSSCVTQRRCLEKFPVKDTVVYHDTVYQVHVPPADTVIRWGEIHDTVYASSGTASGQAWVTHDTLWLNVWQRDTVVQYRDSIKVETKVVTVQQPCRKTPVLNRIVAIGVILLVILLVAKIRFR